MKSLLIFIVALVLTPQFFLLTIKSKVSVQSKDDNYLWTQLFTSQRQQSCVNSKINSSVKINNQQSIDGSITSKSSGSIKQFIKKWGYGAVAYLIDYLDAVLLKDMITDFSKIFDELRSVSSISTGYKDPYDIMLNSRGSTEEDLKLANPNYVKEIFENSINAIQLNAVMKKWGWNIGEVSDYAKEFVSKFDINTDGRLNAREMILGIIVQHQDSANLCYNCLLLLKKKLSVIFREMDCLNKGYLSSEEIWSKLPDLNRKNEVRWNLFSIENNNNIRTASINDFILKNGDSKQGIVTESQFVSGILLAFWDRQTSQLGIISNDSQSLKSLRWSDDGMKDKLAYQGMNDN